jgi:predicted MFS family arabinose efflux permease
VPQQGRGSAGRGTGGAADDRAARRGGHVGLNASPDARLLIASRGVRGFVDGAVAVVLSGYLTLLGYSGQRIGVIVTGMLLGSAALTLWVGLRGGRLARRQLLHWGAITMIVTGVVYGLSTTFAVLLVIGVIGTMNPTSGDVSVFSPVEQSLLPSTVGDDGRTALFARYVFVGTLCAAIGSLAAGLPEWISGHSSIEEGDALRAVFVVYALGGVIVLFVFRRLSPSIEPPAGAPPTPLGPSRSIVYRLALVFSVDSFGGGFVVQTVLALWLFRRFDMSVGAAGALLSWMGLCAAISMFASARLAARIGLIRTMAFTHMPAQVFLIAAALMPNLVLVMLCLTARSLLSAMDVPARNSYVMAVVSPPERAAAASVTQVPRSFAAAIPPSFAGWMLDRSSFGWPLIAAGGLKLIYDVTLLVMFRHVRPPEEQVAGSAPQPISR